MGDLILADKVGDLTGTQVSSSAWRFVRCRMEFLFQTIKPSPQRAKWLDQMCYFDLAFITLFKLFLTWLKHFIILI